MTSLASLDINSSYTSGTYSISTTAELQKLATMVNNGKFNSNRVEFVLANDIDLSSVSNWTAIGNSSNGFKGAFDGNGYSIKNLTMISDADCVGLFGYVYGRVYGGTIKNLSVENVDVTYTGNDNNAAIGGLAGAAVNCTIQNCYVSGSISASDCGYVGGLVGFAQAVVENTHTNVNVEGGGCTGGLVGTIEQSSLIDSCYSEGVIKNRASAGCAGGLIGTSKESRVQNSYTSTHTKFASQECGGVVGRMVFYCSFTSVYSNGTSSNERIPSFAGQCTTRNTIISCGTTGGAPYIGSSSGTNVGEPTQMSEAEIAAALESIGLNTGGSTKSYAITISETDTFGSVAAKLSEYGIDMDVEDGRVTFVSGNGSYVDGSFAAALGVGTAYETITTTKTVGSNTTGSALSYTVTYAATEDTTFADIGINSNRNYVINRSSTGESNVTLSVTKNTKIGEWFRQMGEYGIDGDIHNGTITLQSDTGHYITGTLANDLGIGTNTYTQTVHGTATHVVDTTGTYTLHINTTQTVDSTGTVTLDVAGNFVFLLLDFS